MKQYTRLIFLLLLVAIVLFGIYANVAGLYTQEKVTGQTIVFPSVTGCNPANQICETAKENNSIGFHLPNDAVYLRDFPVEVYLKGFDKDAIQFVQIDFYMSGMDMGINRLQLQPQNLLLWSGIGKLPICATGRTDWLAKVTVKIDETVFLADFIFDVSPATN